MVWHPPMKRWSAPVCFINRIVRSVRRPGLRGSSLALLGIVELPKMIPRSDWLGVSEKSLLNQKSRFYHQIHHNQPCMHTHIYILYIILQIFKILSLSQIIHIFCTFFLKNNMFLGVPHANRLEARLVDLLRRQKMHLLVLQNQLPRGLAEGNLQQRVETPAEISVETC